MTEVKPMEQKSFDLAIVGAGPAGLAASIYASRYKLSNIVIGKTLGGELSSAHNICNYPGFENISGIELVGRWKKQAENLDAEVLLKEVGRIEKKNNGFVLKINGQEKYLAKALIVATGSERRRLNIPGEKLYIGRGVSYCHVCDATFFKNKTVVIIGGSDSAVSGAVHTADYAEKVYVIYRGEKLRAEPMWVDECSRLEDQDKVEVIYNTNIKEILGDGTKVTQVKLDKSYQGSDLLATDGVFIEVGSVPGTSIVQPLGVKLDDSGHVIVNEEMETNITGLFCAGDMVNKSAQFKQATWAIAQGARAAASAFKYLKKEQAPQIIGV
jgi:thioredoxin reductase (NADPH)